MSGGISFDGIPGGGELEDDAVVLKTRINTAWRHFLDKTRVEASDLHVSVGPPTPAEPAAATNRRQSRGKPAGISVEERAAQYQSREPLYTFDQLIVPESVRSSLILASRIITLEKRVFDEWGLRKIEPYPRSALNFYGEPGTGKTLAAHALASHMGCAILLASYAQIESMYHGEGPKNAEALFFAAQRDRALLFIDEADSLLSKRLTNVTQGSEQAINELRSQLLLCLERFTGVVVFATNLVKNYDQAFETRVRNIHFPMPDEECRRLIWSAHLPPMLPIANDVDVMELARIDALCGREIRNAIVDAALQAAILEADHVTRKDIVEAIERVKASRIARSHDTVVHTLNDSEQFAVADALKQAAAPATPSPN
jgi:SpoVK/Ycf46/Vps4 family AAA+-type ATPase